MSNIPVRAYDCSQPPSPNPLASVADARNSGLIADRSELSPARQLDLLTREADHRIRNNLQVLAGLMNRRARDLGPEAAEALAAAAAQVSAVATLHAFLHVAPPGCAGQPGVDLSAYLEGLVQCLRDALDLDTGPHRLDLDVQIAFVAPEVARSLGLIVAELVANAQRHAFAPDRSGTIRIAGAARLTDSAYQLAIEDDGRGLPSGFDLRLRPTGFGLRLVSLLADQIRARLTVRSKPGTRFLLTLPNRP